MTSDQAIFGQGKARTRILITPISTTTLFDVSLASGGYNSLNIRGLSVVTKGAGVGQSILRTPKNSEGLTNKHSFYVDDLYSLGTAPWVSSFDVGDHVNGSLSNIDLRGSYNAALPDAGQAQTTGISLDCAQGGFGFQIFNFKMSGFRTPIFIGVGVEAFYVRDGESTTSWYGIRSTQPNSSPGGNVQNVHISANKYPIHIANRRNFQIDNVQLYRNTGVADDHTGDWAGLVLSNCSRVNLSAIQVRHPDEYKSSSARVGVQIATNSFNISLNGLSCGYGNGLTSALVVINSQGVTACGIVCEQTSSSIVQLIGGGAETFIGPIAYNSSLISSVPISISAGSSVSSVKVSRDSTYIPKFNSRELVSSTPDVYMYAGVDASHTELIDVEVTTAYTQRTTLQNDNALYGDEFSFRVVINAAQKATLEIRNEDLSIQRAFTATGDYWVTWIFNGTQWTVKAQGDN